MVSVDGGGAGINAVKSGCINATSQQYPLLMADLGVQAIHDIVKNGTKPTTSEGLDFFNTGVKLITDDPQEGIPSETTEYGLANAWG
jgi:fructose transport system substrate-binding protein